MEKDKLCLFNTKLIEPLVSMSDDELWNFILANEEHVKRMHTAGKYPKTMALYVQPQGEERMAKFLRRELEYYREGVIYTLVMDFCFEGEKIELDYWARCGFLDNADSCGVKTSEDVMPPVEEDSDEFYYKKYFHLLEPSHVEGIIGAMEKNFAKLTVNTRKDIAKIKRMKKFCLKNEGYNVAYIYDI